MKSYTDIHQSKKLAEILPVKSADMVYIDTGYCSRVLPSNDIDANSYPTICPCWSLAALLNYLREIDSFPEIDADEFAVTMKISYFYYDVENEYQLEHMDSINVKEESFIDACVEIILNLHKQKLL